MSMMHITTAILCSVFIGCSAPLYLYQVNGAPRDQRSSLVITAKATGVLSGTISFSLPSGESYEGPWRPFVGGQVDNELSEVWDSIYGKGYYVANVLGSRQHARADISSASGVVFHLELFKSSVEGSPLIGVGKDSKGNIYKITG